MREEEDRKIAEQVSLSHRADYHTMNKNIMDNAGATEIASAGVQQEEVKQSFAQSVMDRVRKETTEGSGQGSSNITRRGSRRSHSGQTIRHIRGNGQ